MLSTKSSYQYYNLSQQKIIEGATTITPEIIPTQKLLLGQKKLKYNWGLTFTVKLDSGSNDTWQQIIGLTPSSNADDKRFFAVWLCPKPHNETLYFRTATTASVNDNIIDCASFTRLEIGKYYRFNVLCNIADGGDKQYITVTMENITDKQGARQIYSSGTPSNPPLSRPLYSGNIDIYMFASYNNFAPIKGELKDVAFVTTEKEDNVVISYLQKAVEELPKIASRKNNIINTFTTMSESAVEGLENIGGLGNNGNIRGITPPVNGVTVTASPAVNYSPISSPDGQSYLCAKSVVQTTDPSFNWISNYGYNYPIEFNSSGQVSKSVPICSPDELYTVQKQILNELNIFNAEYSDYMTYTYNKRHSALGDTSPKLPYAGGKDESSAAAKYANKASVTDLDEYQLLLNDLQTYNNLLKANKAYYPDPEKADDELTKLSRIDPVVLARNHKEIVNERNALDAKLFELNNVQNSAAGESKMHMDSSIYVTLLWTTLATSIVYFMFV